MNYNILLIITDGEIHDMATTKDLIVQASALPLSIIIVGVGNERFEMMVELDSDDTILRDSHGRAALGDIVQFVKFSDFAYKGSDLLAEEVLQEVPDQFVQYMMRNNIKPQPLVHPDINSLI